MTDIKRYDCTNGRAQHCYGCYQMTESEYGDYVEFEEYSRIVAAKDAEIARLKELAHETGATVSKLLKAKNEKRDELIALKAQLARQVSGDEREQFEAWAQQNGISITRTPQALAFANGHRRTAGDYIMVEALCAYAAWQARAAALAPAAVVMPERKPDLEAMTDHWRENYRAGEADGYNEALDEVARLNRRAIPEGLLERIAKIPLGSQGLLDHASAMDELRALLGKED